LASADTFFSGGAEKIIPKVVEALKEKEKI